MKEDPNKLIGKKYMPVIKEHDFFWWKYDDRSSAAIHCDWITVVRAFRKKAPSYVHPTSTMRLDSQKSENVLILKLDELKFLPQEILSAMNSLYQ